jgi:hypothetical protein
MQQAPKRYCPNCYYPLPDYGSHCSNCSQKFTDGKVTFWVLIRDLFESVLNVDSKIFRTIGALFIPGKLTEDFFQGKQKRYVPPLRLFFVMAVIHFAVIGYFMLDDVKRGLADSIEGSKSEAYMAVFRNQLDSAQAEVAAGFSNDPKVSAAFDSLKAYLDDTRQDSIELSYLVYDGALNFEGKAVKVAVYDAMEMPLDSLPSHYGVEGFWQQLVLRQVAKLNREGSDFGGYVLSKLIWMVVLMMPALALVLKLLYIRRERYYVEHVVFSFNYHAFAFLLASVLILIGAFTHESFGENLTGLFFIAVLFYLYKSMRRFYKQGRVKTFLKYAMVNIAYVMIFLFFFSLMAVVTALTF